MRRPGDPKSNKKRFEKNVKKLREEKSLKTSKTSTLSSEMRGFSDREWPKILKNRPPGNMDRRAHYQG